ncbi:MAG: tetratricopeptide repeat protein [Myxococcales bacterium]|nr:tetratricopeptide repeat protein [Myxococcales bacterium]
MDPIVTTEIPVPTGLREPTEAEVRAAKDVLAQLDAEVRALGKTAAAAPVHYAMGRIFVEQLGDQKNAAICYQNAFLLNPKYRPNLEAARRLFARAGRLEKALALHQREEALLRDPAPRAESLRAQAMLLHELKRDDEAKRLIGDALQLAPEHPALLKASIEAAHRDGDRLLCARLLVRSAGVTRDPVYKAQQLRRAVLLIEELQIEPEGNTPRSTPWGHEAASGEHDVLDTSSAGPQELAALHEEAVRKLYQADANDQVGFLGMLLRARANNDWEAVLRMCRQRAERSQNASDRWLVAAVAAFRLGRVSEGLAEVKAALEDNRRDGALLALRSELAEQQKSADLPELLRQRAEGCIEASERGHLKFRAAMLLADPLEREQLLSDALAENPGDAAAIALHARLVAQRDAAAAGERFVTLGEALESHSADEAAAHYIEAGAWHERAGNREEAASLARRALALVPRHAGALRLLIRTMPGPQLADVLEESSSQLPRAVGAELLARAAALVTESQPERAILLAQRAAEMARGLTTPRWLETWALLAFKAGDFARLSQALEARADSTHGADAADLLLEASELSRAVGDDARSTTMLRKARGVDPQSAAARNAMLALPTLPAAERCDLLLEEARQTTPERAAALHAERAAVLEIEGRIDEAVQACAQALALAGVDLAVLRRLSRLQLRRGDHGAALAVLVQIAEAVPEGHPRAEAYGRAAELAEWRVGEPRRAIELYRLAAQAHPPAAFAWAQLARLLTWTGRHAEAAEAYEKLAGVAQSMSDRIEARRWAASLYAHRASEAARAAELLRALIAESPGDLEAMSELLALIANDTTAEVRRERAELRGRLASRCQDPRVAALLRSESAEDRLAAGERDQGIAEFRRALALNPQDRVALDLVEEALRSSGQKSLLAEHLTFRSAFADPETRAALALQQAEIYTEQGRLDDAGAAYNLALSSDPDSLLAVKGARHIAELNGDKQEVVRLLAREASLAPDPGAAAGAMVEAALLEADMGDSTEAVQRLTTVLEGDPANTEAAQKLRGVLGEGAARTLSGIYERIGHDHADARLGAVAWARAAAIELDELNDAPAAFFAAGRALARDPDCIQALETRADSGEVSGRPQDAADALQKRLALAAAGEPRAAGWKSRLGRLHADLGDAEKALPLLGDEIATLDGPLLLKVAAGARSLAAADEMRLYRRLIEVFPAPAEPAPTRAQLAEWTHELAKAELAAGQLDEALAAFRRAVELDPQNRAALQQISTLTRTPEEAIAAHRALIEMTPPPIESLHALAGLFKSAGREDAAYCAAAALVGLGVATPEERAMHEGTASKPPPVELPQLADNAAVHAPGDDGPARELLAAAAAELARALPTDMSGGRGALVKGDNPVRRVVTAIARALGISEPALFLARTEPAVVAPVVSAEAPALLVGLDVPKRYTPRQQRFLYARALGHIRRGTHAVAVLAPQRLGAVVAELVRLAAPAVSQLSKLPPADPALAELLARQVSQEARARLAPLAARAAVEMPASWEPLALAIRESAERAGLAVSADPAAAISIVAAECPGGIDRPEVARLVRFSISDAYIAIRPK